jgi:hypothetical protein
MKVKIGINKASQKKLAQKIQGYKDEVLKPIADANEITTRSIIRDARRNLKVNGTDNTGGLRNSMKKVGTQDNGLIHEIAPTVHYALDIEEGTPPHKIASGEYGDLSDWVRKKLGVSGNEVGRATYYVSKKIAEEGTDAQPFWFNAIALNEDKHIRNIKRELKKFFKK